MADCCGEGPFIRGVAPTAENENQQCFADCCDKLCPPPECCDTIRISFECGCDCPCAPLGFLFKSISYKEKLKPAPKIPTFTKKQISGNGFVFAQLATVPCDPCGCESWTVDLTTDGCCLYLGSENIEAVGPGTVSAVAAGASIEDCTISLYLNGVEQSSVVVADGDVITVELMTSGVCSCCELGRACDGVLSGFLKPLYKKLAINKQEIKNKINSIIKKIKRKK